MGNNLHVTGNLLIDGSSVFTGTVDFNGGALDAVKVTNFNADKVDGADLDTSTALGTSDVKVPSQNAVKVYVDTLDTQDVKLTGDQTVAGVKTFSSAVVANLTGNVTGKADEADEADGVVETGTGAATLKCKVIQIDDWNMVASASKSIAHGLTLGKIRFAKALIRHDLDTTHYDLNQGNASTGFLQGWIAFDATNITLLRLTGGVFDNVGFDSTSYNRGWITIWYEV